MIGNAPPTAQAVTGSAKAITQADARNLFWDMSLSFSKRRIRDFNWRRR
jgi:hypothetical protein